MISIFLYYNLGVITQYKQMHKVSKYYAQRLYIFILHKLWLSKVLPKSLSPFTPPIKIPFGLTGSSFSIIPVGLVHSGVSQCDGASGRQKIYKGNRLHCVTLFRSQTVASSSNVTEEHVHLLFAVPGWMWLEKKHSCANLVSYYIYPHKSQVGPLQILEVLFYFMSKFAFLLPKIISYLNCVSLFRSKILSSQLRMLFSFH